jgi:hypothetical protein
MDNIFSFLIFGNIVEGLLSKDIFTGIVNEMVLKTSAVASAVIVLSWAINFGYNYFSNSIKDQAKKIDFPNLVGSLLVVGVFWVYIPVVGGIIQFVFLFNDAVKLNDAEWDKMVKNVYNNTDPSLKFTDPTNDKYVYDGKEIDYDTYIKLPLEEKLKYVRRDVMSGSEEFSMWTMDPMKFISSGLAFITATITSMIRVIIQAIVMGLIKILYVVGPLAIVFSLVPIWKDKLGTWFSTMINMCFVLTTMSILDQLILGSAWDTSALPTKMNVSVNYSETQQSLIGQMGNNIAYIVNYLLVFWLTSKYIGSDDAGRALGTAAQVGMQTLSAVRGIGGGKGVGGNNGGDGGGGNNVNSVSSTAKDPMSKR